LFLPVSLAMLTRALALVASAPHRAHVSMALEPVADFRSDTVTTPTASMRTAMAEAEVGDDVFGDDPTVIALEARVAALFDKEAALYVPSGTMGNLICTMAHCWERGSEYIVGDKAHIYLYEAGGGATLGGAHPRAIPTAADGTLALDDILGAVRADDHHFPVTRMVTLENTHNMAGGRVLQTDYVRSVADAAHDAGATLHLDGARLWHAAAYLEEDLATVGGPADSISLCLSKGLGAPVGSVIVGTHQVVRERGRRLRKALGGTMRQAGVLAAAGLVALDEVLPGLSEDHVNAQVLHAGLEALGFAVEPAQTNLVFFSAQPETQGLAAAELVAAAEAHGVRFLCIGGQRMRMVLHHQVGADEVERALAVINDVLSDPERARNGAAGSAAYAGGQK
jgi:threonine aldolase